MLVESVRIEKPWGYEIIWAHCDKFVGKLLTIKKGKRLSRQYHVVKEETILVLSGVLSLELGQKENYNRLTLNRGESFHITPNTIHRFCAEEGDVLLAEVSTPELEDVTRIEDDYQRAD